MKSDWMARNPRAGALFLAVVAIFAIAGIIVSCSGARPQHGLSMGTVNVTMSDPPSCMPPNGQFTHVYITVRSVQAHISATATTAAQGGRSLRRNWPARRCRSIYCQATDHLHSGAAWLRQSSAGSYQQIRLLLVSNTTAASAGPSTNACPGNGFNCLCWKIEHSRAPAEQPGQYRTENSAGPDCRRAAASHRGPKRGSEHRLQRLRFDCAGRQRKFRLKPTLTAGQISANNTESPQGGGFRHQKRR